MSWIFCIFELNELEHLNLLLFSTKESPHPIRFRFPPLHEPTPDLYAVLSGQARIGMDLIRFDAIGEMAQDASKGIERNVVFPRWVAVGWVAGTHGMIDEMVVTLKKEQDDDDHKKEYCAAQFEQSDDKKKKLERSIRDSETVIADTEDGIDNLKGEIKALGASITALDASVTDATEQRKEENESFTQLMASNSAAKEILGFAKNRLRN